MLICSFEFEKPSSDSVREVTATDKKAQLQGMMETGQTTNLLWLSNHSDRFMCTCVGLQGPCWERQEGSRSRPGGGSAAASTVSCPAVTPFLSLSAI